MDCGGVCKRVGERHALDGVGGCTAIENPDDHGDPEGDGGDEGAVGEEEAFGSFCTAFED